MKKCVAVFLSALALCGCGKKFSISEAELADKIKGGWAGQFIGCAYGGPTEFKYVNAIIPPEAKLGYPETEPLADGEFGGLYDDVYMDAAFLSVLEQRGLSAPREAFAKAVAEAPFQLWCANKAARFEFLDGYMIGEPASWRRNPNSNDIDFQIEADFAGLVSPAMPNAAISFCETVGRIFNSGEGYYCGACVAAMYSLAFKTSSPREIVGGAAEILPKKSYARALLCQIMDAHKKSPNDWRAAWQIVSRQYGSPKRTFGKDMLYAPYNLAYVAIGLLYGGGDFEKTIDIATRCGLDSDCNPATAGGILGAALGYSRIPIKFRRPLELAENKPICGVKYTPATLYAAGLKVALEVLKKNGAEFSGGHIRVPCPPAKRVAFEAPAPRMKIARTQKISLGAGGETAVKFSERGVEVFVYGYTLKNKKLAQTAPMRGEIARLGVSINGAPKRGAKFFGDAHRVERKFAFADFDLARGEKTISLSFAKTNPLAADFECELRFYEPAQ